MKVVRLIKQCFATSEMNGKELSLDDSDYRGDFTEELLQDDDRQSYLRDVQHFHLDQSIYQKKFGTAKTNCCRQSPVLVSVFQPPTGAIKAEHYTKKCKSCISNSCNKHSSLKVSRGFSCERCSRSSSCHLHQQQSFFNGFANKSRCNSSNIEVDPGVDSKGCRRTESKMATPRCVEPVCCCERCEAECSLFQADSMRLQNCLLLYEAEVGRSEGIKSPVQLAQFSVLSAPVAIEQKEFLMPVGADIVLGGSQHNKSALAGSQATRRSSETGQPSNRSTLAAALPVPVSWKSDAYNRPRLAGARLQLNVGMRSGVQAPPNRTIGHIIDYVENKVS